MFKKVDTQRKKKRITGQSLTKLDKSLKEFLLFGSDAIVKLQAFYLLVHIACPPDWRVGENVTPDLPVQPSTKVGIFI